jgi:hypothetical protein
VRKLTVAVLVNDRASGGPTPTTAPRTPAELARIDTLVRAAVGIDSARGDQLAVVNVAFDGTGIAGAAVDETPTVWTRIEQYQKPITAGATLVASSWWASWRCACCAAAKAGRTASGPALDPAYAAAVAAAAQRAGLPWPPARPATPAADAANQALALRAGPDAAAALAAGDARPAILIAPRQPTRRWCCTSARAPCATRWWRSCSSGPRPRRACCRNWMRQD